jgi:glycosyltransferase involved in cell wall biosynthesis
MHYVIEEFARMRCKSPFLQLVGAADESSPEIIELGNTLLGPENFNARSVPSGEVASYYKASNCFVLASLQEGFGRVYVEALAHGLPVIAHRHPVMSFVLGDQGVLADLTQPGALASLMESILATEPDPNLYYRRWRSVKARFCWSVLKSAYRDMFVRFAGEKIST